MRVKTFIAPSMVEAMQQVRAALGDDAIILSSEAARGEVRLVAALDTDDADADAAATETLAPADNTVPAALAYHGVPEPLAERLQRAAATSSADSEPAQTLAAAFERTLAFHPLGERPPTRPLMLVGPAGAGKTLTAAKLIVDAHRRHRRVVAASCDTQRAGGIEQLQAFTRILDIPLARIEAPAALAGVAGAGTDEVVVIDTAGTCPFSRGDLDELSRCIEAAEAEPILVLAAGGDGNEAAETAAAFAGIGCRRMIATRIDVSRRLGAPIAAAAAGRLAFAGAGISPHAADPPAPVSPLSLSRLLLSMAPRPAPMPDPRKETR